MIPIGHSVVYKSARGGENPLTTGVKQAVPYRTGREARYLSVSTESNQIKSINKGKKLKRC